MNFYFEAAKTLDRLDAKESSIKGTLATLPEKDRKRTAALVIETLKFKQVLTDVVTISRLLKEERKITSMNLALVLVHDVLLSNGIQAGSGPVKQAVLRHKTRLHAEFQKIKIKRGAKSNLELAESGDPRAGQIPRYVRVNTAVWTTDEAVQSLTSRGFKLSDIPGASNDFAKDAHIPDLLLFPPQTQFHDDPAYKSGKLILQDKASCFPAVVLAPPAHDDGCVIDATAAPGNKTSHLSALMGNKGKLFAFERDRTRFSTLKMMLSKAHCKNVEAINADFLTVDPFDSRYSKVTHILLDPSCSGSGIVNRLDHLLDTEEETDAGQSNRLNKLAAFQLLMVRHAMKFPSVTKIVYSTCSIHAVENEQVVCRALESVEAQNGRFVLASPEDVLPSWPRRGLPNEMNDPGYALSLIRCSPGEDATNGFFVSCLVKNCLDKKASEVSTHLTPIDDLERKRKADGTEEEKSRQEHDVRKKKKRRKKKSDI